MLLRIIVDAADSRRGKRTARSTFTLAGNGMPIRTTSPTPNVRLARQRPRQRLPPSVELRAIGGSAANQHIQRQLALFGDANLVGAGEPAGLGPDWDRAARIGGNLEPHEHGVVSLIDVVHEAGDGQPLRHRIAQRACGEALGKLPLHVHRQAGVARVQPIAVPAGSWTHVDRKLDLAAGGCGALGDQLRLDTARVGERRARRSKQEREASLDHKTFGLSLSKPMSFTLSPRTRTALRQAQGDRRLL